MKKHPLLAYFGILAFLSALVIGIIYGMGQKGMYFAQIYMLIPAISAIITRLFFYEKRFANAHLKLGKAKDWLKFWFISACLAILSYLFFTLFGAVEWDFSGQAFLDKLAAQFAEAGQSMENTLPPWLTPHKMLLLYAIGSLTLFNILPGLITGMGEEFGHRGLMFTLWAEINLKKALVFGGLVWFAWHLPLALIMPVKQELSGAEQILNAVVLSTGSVFTHIYLAFVLMKSRSIWITALAHISFNNVSTALSFFVVITDQTLANLGLVLTMVFAVVIGIWKFNFWQTLTGEKQPPKPEINTFIQ
ncbi:MAG TPA: hypothetical protein DIW47_13365 [Bacteroidetes bacterium]|nr:hypothetical protein [Bacteroidota bacterium]